MPHRPPRSIVVSGEGKVSVAPDSASFTVGVEATAKTVGAATAEVTEVVAQRDAAGRQQESAGRAGSEEAAPSHQGFALAAAEMPSSTRCIT
jgi:type IV secretory pathway TrbL component